ncbi:MAG TPA: sigma-70 family RNA polymerase sigma factor [Acidimicrobiia bacterium]|nr:sigma-70 family RNA polymerase sigma factor [Acidimicrobiia bacterium]
MPLSPADVEARRQRFLELADETFEPLRRYVRRRVEIDVVDDVVAETMLTLWRRLEDIPSQGGLPWAYGVARRHIANHRRASRRHLSLVRRVEAEPAPPPVGEAPLNFELDAALDRLQAEERELLRLWAWEELEPREIAVVLGLTVNAATIRLHRAKKKLARNLEEVRKNQLATGQIHQVSRKE